MFWPILLIFVLIRKVISVENEQRGLRLVHILYRHGARTPCWSYPTDPYKDRTNWPEGLCNITRIGRENHLQLGYWLRKRYHGFLKLYNQEEIYARSTNIDRTLISTRLTLTGLCTNHPLHHVPIHTSPLEKDILLYSEHTECEKLTQLKKLFEENKLLKKLKVYKDLLEYLNMHTERSILSFSELYYLYDTLATEEFYNKTLPRWTKAVFPGGLFGELWDQFL